MEKADFMIGDRVVPKRPLEALFPEFRISKVSMCLAKEGHLTVTQVIESGDGSHIRLNGVEWWVNSSSFEIFEEDFY